MRAVLHTDGGARGNPGPAAIGLVLEFPASDLPTYEHAETIGKATNNVAEYTALLRGLQEALRRKATAVECVLDSELVVRQIAGVYRVRDPHLRALWTKVQELRGSFSSVEFRTVPRRENARADRLVNKALDRGRHERSQGAPVPRKRP